MDHDAVVIAHARALLAVDDKIAVLRMFRAPRGAHLTARPPGELAVLMDQVEQAARQPRARSRHLDT